MDSNNKYNGFKLPDKDESKPYAVPEGYFEQLTGRIMERVVKKEKNVVRAFFFRPGFMYAASIAALAFILFSALYYLTGMGANDHLERLTVSMTEDSLYITDVLLYDVNEEDLFGLAGGLATTDGKLIPDLAGLTDEEIISYLSIEEINPYELNE